MKISCFALGKNIENNQYFINIRNALVGMGISYSQLYCRENKKELKHLIYPFLSEDGSQRIYFIMSLIVQSKQLPDNTLTIDMFKASQLGEIDIYEVFPLNYPTCITIEEQNSKEENNEE